MSFERELDAMLKIDQYWRSELFYVSNNQTSTQQGFTTFIVVYGSDVTDVKRHKKRRNFVILLYDNSLKKKF